ncbi:TPA_exp: putative C2H2 transcription factor [Trichophyton benhamiae CBS 112371]|uniref:C2H2 transcription factor, putative n=1 Tax=Arthroderma benhamiae (strain ATCC MYA-4681 / CBS 112371) TaxID=663331 RepID=D4AYD4_ARTBC|nr:C2H2 transcription factor, putative [Trichophyton benhamiae CBS 112371]EFE31950.1 C2H2 transcription factor, putative [Trichophyton benhamiae CBS 112371]DAA75060.1 TPA_exp: putative C2H2 transcription factor [Trichophyton benhamiae CBS 112371]
MTVPEQQQQQQQQQREQRKEPSPGPATSVPTLNGQPNGQPLAGQNGIASHTELASNHGTNDVTVTEQHRHQQQQQPQSAVHYAHSHTSSVSPHNTNTQPAAASTPNRTSVVSREGSSTHSSNFDEMQHPESDGDHYQTDNEIEMGGTGDAGPSGTGPAGTSGAATTNSITAAANAVTAAAVAAVAATANAAGGPPSKKKKGQRFYCTEFPPCNLNFTRSEHLARHIRKHTGERPFQCHCSRRFSRLDNLRQHAQTVHVNENIPCDSLAASGTRFQRQVRTDRVRHNGRARAGTAGSHSHSHSRNLSTSSISSNMSSYAPQHQELRRRPQPLMMAGSGAEHHHHTRSRHSLSLETRAEPPKTPPNQSSAPGPTFTPSSATYDQSSPYYASPSSAYGSSHWPDRNVGRRLSVPTSTRPFDPSHQNYPSQPPYTRMTHPPYPSQSIAPAPPPVMAPAPTDPAQYAAVTPTSAIDSGFEADPRRRTWHPSSYTGFARPPQAPSGLWYQQSAEAPGAAPGGNVNVPPLSSPSQPTTTRLPGIESFDHVPPRLEYNREREVSPRSYDRHHYQPQPYSQPPPPPSHLMGSTPFAPTFNAGPRPAPPFSGAEHRRGQLSLDTTLQRTLTRLDLHGNSSSGGSTKDAASWGQATMGELQSIGSRPSTGAGTGPLKEDEDEMEADEGPGPSVPTETSPTHHQPVQYETNAADHHSHSVHQLLLQQQQEQQHQQLLPTRPSGGAGLGRLQALVDIATSETEQAKYKPDDPAHG